jgi:hypothetical protein
MHQADRLRPPLLAHNRQTTFPAAAVLETWFGLFTPFDVPITGIPAIRSEQHQDLGSIHGTDISIKSRDVYRDNFAPLKPKLQ